MRAHTNASDKSVVFSANAWIGGDGVKAGIPVEAGSRYDFSLEVRGEIPKATINIQELLFPVVPDVLHIVVIFHNVDELFHQLDLLLVL